MFGLSTYELLTVLLTVAGVLGGGVFWCGKVYQRLCDMVALNRVTVLRQDFQEKRLARVERVAKLRPLPTPPELAAAIAHAATTIGRFSAGGE